MKKRSCFIVAAMLGIFSTASFASIQSFWAYGSSDSASEAKYLHGNGNKASTKSISINYEIENSWTVNSASLWIKAVDDFKNGGPCSGSRCIDGRRKGRDASELAHVSNIEGSKGNYASVEINGEQWYQLLDVTSFLMGNSDNTFTALIKASKGRDFWFKNAKLVIDYSIKEEQIPAVPVPSAIWLFGSALLGLMGFRRNTREVA